jgi:ketosteroid isomerase-like protein
MKFRAISGHGWARLSLAFMLCLMVRVARAQEAPHPEAAEQIRKLEDKWTEAYRERDLDLLSSLLTEDFVITVEDGNTFSKAGYITHTADTSVHVEVAEMSDVRVRVRPGGGVAVVNGTYHEKGRAKDKPYEYFDKFTDVWVRGGTGWRVLASHYSVPVK